MPTTSVEPPKAFNRHRAKDEGYNSICLTCFRAVATARRERDLTRVERKHKCSPHDLAFQPKFGPTS